jgi:carbon storage regulator
MGLLVLTRGEDESVMIGDDVEVIVVEVKGSRVRLGFRGPQDVKIHRREVWLDIQREKADGDESRAEGDRGDFAAASGGVERESH